MRDASGASGRHQDAARARWGSTKIDRYAEELATRVAEISPDVRAQLTAALEETMTATDPESRRRFLDAYRDPADPAQDSISRLCAAERLAEVTLQDWTAAGDRLRDATIAAPGWEIAADRELSPADRSAVVEVYGAQEAEARAAGAYHRAKAHLDVLTEAFERCSRPNLGLPSWPDTL